MNQLILLARESLIHDDVDVLESLLAQGLEPPACFENTPLIFSALHAPVCLRRLLDAGWPLPSERSSSLAFCAASKGFDESLRMLIQAGADFHAPQAQGVTPLSVAADEGHARCVDILLGAGADPDVPDVWARSPAMKAAKRGHAAILRSLVGAGANAFLVDKHGQTALDWARHSRLRGQGECEEFLKAVLAAREEEGILAQEVSAPPRSKPRRV